MGTEAWSQAHQSGQVILRAAGRR